jgi:DNA-binding CsgD family transcriptional regulator
VATPDAFAVVGRDEEVATVEKFLAAGERRSRALLLEGDAGIGKTTLWRAAVARAQAGSWRVLTCSAAMSETQLAFASLRDLCEGIDDDAVADLPSPQRRALEVALLRADPDEAVPEQGAISLGLLGVLRELAERSRVLIAIDDAQWLDTASASVFEFVARRLDGAPVALLVACRPHADHGAPLGLDRAFPEDRLRRQHIGALSLGALHHLLHLRLETIFPRPTLRRLHEVSGGNPFYALELARALERHGGHLRVGETLPVPRRLHELVGERLAALPAEAIAVVEVAAAASAPTVEVVTTVAEAHASAIDAAVQAQLIELDEGRIRFTHPLFASGAYAALGPMRRRQLHARLARVVDEPEERARHLALAADGPDSAVATILEEAAHRARARGAPGAAGELAEQAHRLTPLDQVDDALRRTMDAAGFHYEAGDAAKGRALLEEAAASAAPGPHRAEALKRLGRAHAFEADLRVAAELYREAIAESGEARATRAEAEGGLAVALMRMLADLPTAARHARTATELAEQEGDSRALAEFLSARAVIEGLIGDPEAATTMGRAVDVGLPLEGRLGMRQADFLTGLWGPTFMRAVLGAFTDDVEGARAIIEKVRAGAVVVGDEASLPLILRYLSYVELLAGNWERAEAWGNEGYDAAVQTGQPSQQAVLAATRALIHAHLGRVEETRSEAAEALRLAEETGAMFARLLALSALGLLELSSGRPADALEQLEPLVEDLEAAGLQEPGVARFVPDTIQAMLAVGRSADAEALLGRLEERAERLDRPSGRAAAARCRGLLLAASTDFEGALTSLEQALGQHERVSIPFDRARTLLAVGAVERRAKHKGAARAALGEALAEFERLGASLWAGEARAELARIGGRAPSGGELTPAEQRVAELVLEGLSNKQVAAALFVTRKTVETQLSRIYAKLGIHSRTELARRVSQEREASKL